MYVDNCSLNIQVTSIAQCLTDVSYKGMKDRCNTDKNKNNSYRSKRKRTVNKITCCLYYSPVCSLLPAIYVLPSEPRTRSSVGRGKPTINEYVKSVVGEVADVSVWPVVAAVVFKAFSSVICKYSLFRSSRYLTVHETSFLSEILVAAGFVCFLVHYKEHIFHRLQINFITVSTYKANGIFRLMTFT